MANREMYDDLSVVTPDVNQTLSVKPQGVITEIGSKNQEIHVADDNSEERIGFSDDSIFYVTLQWPAISESDSGTLQQFYHDPLYGNARLKTFKWSHPTDGHTYVIRFDSDFERAKQNAAIWGVLNVRFRVLGKISD